MKSAIRYIRNAHAEWNRPNCTPGDYGFFGGYLIRKIRADRAARRDAKPEEHEGATKDWSPTDQHRLVEPELPDVELVKRSEDDLIVHNLLNTIEANLRNGLDMVCDAIVDRITQGDPVLKRRALVAADETQEIRLEIRQLPTRPRRLALPVGSAA